MNKDFVLNVGDKIYYKNVFGETRFGEVSLTSYAGKTIKEFEKMKNARVIKVMRPTLETVYERKEILDDVEKEYLSNALKPFRCRVISVEKDERYSNKEYIYVELTTDNPVENDCMLFPDFKKGTMYKDMETNKKYTLEELGL